MNQQTVSSFHYRPSARVHRLCKRTTKCLCTHTMTTRSTCTTPDLPPTFAARLALCKGIHSNKYRPLKSSQTTPNIQLRLLPKQNPYSKPTASCHTFYTVLPSLSLTPPATQYTTLQLPNPMQCLTCSCASSCIHAHLLRGNIR